jgi:CRISPR-associated protein Cas1
MLERANPNPADDRVVVVDGYGAKITVERGHLVIEDGFASEGTLREIYFPRGRCEVERIIVRSPTGNLSLSALDWCNRMGIAIAFVGSNSHLINCMLPDSPHDGPVRRAQALCGTTESAVELAHWLLARKFQSQINAIEHDFRALGLLADKELDRARALRELRGCLDALDSDRQLDGLLVREGRAAQLYWRLLAGVELPWPAWTHKRIPEHWKRVWPRESGGRNRVRDAHDPFNAVLNYSYTLLEVEGRVACATNGLDPDFGLLHVDDRLRESFIYDLIEPVRSTVDALAFGVLTKSGLHPRMFIELRDGIVRLDPDLAKRLAKTIMPQLRKPLNEIAASFASRLRLVEVPYRLVRYANPAVGGYRRGRTPPTNPGFCEYCKERTPKRGLKFCNRTCYLRYSVEIRQPIKLAQAKLVALRQSGISPGHGGAAARLRGAKIAVSNRRRAMDLTADERRALRTLQARVRRAQKKAKPSDGPILSAAPNPNTL